MYSGEGSYAECFHRPLTLPPPEKVPRGHVLAMKDYAFDGSLPQTRCQGISVTDLACGIASDRIIQTDRSSPSNCKGGVGSQAGMKWPCALEKPPVYSWRELQHRYDAIASRRREDEIAFFRHGQTKYNERKLVSGQHNTVLSEQGRREAKVLRRALPSHLDLIACSALSRAIETMRLSVPPALRTRIPIFVDERLNEVHLGEMQGRKSVFVQAFADGNISWSPPGGESYRQAAGRVLSAVADLFDALAFAGPPPRRAAVFCHAGVMRIISTLIDAPAESRNVFKSSAKNLECLSVMAQNVEFPAFWIGGETERDGEHNSFQNTRS
jgi:broad specificity phosphatase PhoE